MISTSIFACLAVSLLLGLTAFLLYFWSDDRQGSAGFILVLITLIVLPGLSWWKRGPQAIAVSDVTVKRTLPMPHEVAVVNLPRDVHLIRPVELPPKSQDVPLAETTSFSSRFADLTLPAWSKGWLFGVGWIWLGGIVFGLIYLVRQLLALRRVMKTLKPAGAQLFNEYSAEAAELGFRKAPALFLSPRGGSPWCAWWGQSFVVLPEDAAVGMDASLRRMIYIHELTHIRRHDLIILALQTFCRLTHWWNPFVHWICRRLTVSREHFCDRAVVERSGAHGYANLLVDLGASSVARPTKFACSMASPFQSVQARIKNIMKVDTQNQMKSRWCNLLRITATTTALAVSVAVVAWVKPVFAVGEVEEPSSVTSPATEKDGGVAKPDEKKTSKASSPSGASTPDDNKKGPTRSITQEMLPGDMTSALMKLLSDKEFSDPMKQVGRPLQIRIGRGGKPGEYEIKSERPLVKGLHPIEDTDGKKTKDVFPEEFNFTLGVQDDDIEVFRRVTEGEKEVKVKIPLSVALLGRARAGTSDLVLREKSLGRLNLSTETKISRDSLKKMFPEFDVKHQIVSADSEDYHLFDVKSQAGETFFTIQSFIENDASRDAAEVDIDLLLIHTPKIADQHGLTVGMTLGDIVATRDGKLGFGANHHNHYIGEGKLWCVLSGEMPEGHPDPAPAQISLEDALESDSKITRLCWPTTTW